MRRGRGEGFRAAPKLLAAPALLAAAFFAPLFRLSPNRIVRGEAIHLGSLSPLLAAAVSILWLGFVASASSKRAFQGRVATLLPFAVFGILLAALARACAEAAASGGGFRLALGSGFWLALLLCYLGYVYASGLASSPSWLGAAALALLAGVVLVLFYGGYLESLSLLREWAAQREVFTAELGRHAAIAGSAVLAGGILGAGIGFAAARSRTANSFGFLALNVVQTIPSLALFGFLIIPLAALAQRFPALRDWGIGGIGPAPALIALSLYAALPVARNSLAALEAVPPAAREAGRGMGMGTFRLFLRVELPLALPVALAGLRTAAVQAVGNAAIAALIGAGGLGVFIFQGLGQFAMDMVLLGTLPLVAMALLVDAAMGLLVRLATPRAFAQVPEGAEP